LLTADEKQHTNCRVYRSMEFDGDHRSVLVTCNQTPMQHSKKSFRVRVITWEGWKDSDNQ